METILKRENIIPALGVGTVAFLLKLESTNKVSFSINIQDKLPLIAFVFSIITIMTIILLLTTSTVEPTSGNVTAGVVVGIFSVLLAVMSGSEVFVKFRKRGLQPDRGESEKIN